MAVFGGKLVKKSPNMAFFGALRANTSTFCSFTANGAIGNYAHAKKNKIKEWLLNHETKHSEMYFKNSLDKKY